MRKYNDYELIYLVQTENCEIALNIIINKYKNLVYKYIHMYFLKETDYDDYFQEGLILIYQAVFNFNERFNKTFTRYYELILRRRMSYLKSKEPKYELHDNFDVYNDQNIDDYDFEIEGLTNFEGEVFKRYYVLNQKISFIAEEQNKSVKQIYNAIYRIKAKYKEKI